MQKVSTVYLPDDSTSLDFKYIHRTISETWEKKAKDLQTRRWQILNQLYAEGKE